MHKTQVFVEHEDDHYRTRLTHSIEVGQVARTIADVLGLNLALTEAVALAHDLGHTPFGHAGEDVLDACMADYGGFDHNAQAIRLVTSLERHYAAFDGLNLTWETLEGIAKHNGPVPDPVPVALAEYNEKHDLALKIRASAEAQVAALADDIAYNNHDLDDGLRAGLFGIADIVDLPLVGKAFRDVAVAYPNLDDYRHRHEALRRVFGAMVKNAVAESRDRIRRAGVETADDVRAMDQPVAAFSDDMLSDISVIRQYLYTNMYRHPKVVAGREEMAEKLRQLFQFFMERPEFMGIGRQTGDDEPARARTVADYISGMTDRYALKMHRQLRKHRI